MLLFIVVSFAFTLGIPLGAWLRDCYWIDSATNGTRAEARGHLYDVKRSQW